MSDAALPVDPDAHPDDQRHQALTFADEQGWLAFEHVTPGKPSERKYVIRVAAPGTPARRLRPHEVLPYVTGQADARGAGHLFPSREPT